MRKLVLKTETLLPLQATELDRVRGGAGTDDGDGPRLPPVPQEPAYSEVPQTCCR